MIQRIGLVLMSSFLIFSCTPNNVKSDAAITKILDSAGVEGCFALMENGSGQFVISDLSTYKDSSFAPLQTFFAIPALVAIDRGYINNTPNNWVPLDSIFYYQSIIEKIGRKDVLKVIDSIRYGKGIVSSDLNSFWKDQSLRITPDEQLGLIKKLYFDQLPFQKRSQDIFKKMILKEDNASYQLSYIAGADSTINANWVLGYVEENKHPYFFVMHTSPSKGNKGNSASSVSILKSILLQQGFLKGVR